MQNNLSVVVLTHNDELRIVDCLEGLRFATELIIIDDNSSDRTVELAQQFTSNIHVRDLQHNFASQRNFALNYAHGNWVLFIDSDEIVSDVLKKEIISKIKSENVNGFFMKRIDFMWGKKILHGEAGSVQLLRLAKKGYGKWHGKVHETWRISGKTGELVHPLIHVPHQSVSEFVKDVDSYSTLRSDELHELGVKSSFLNIIIYPFAKFILNYFIKKGYKDGQSGFVHALIMSFHSFLVRGKLYLKSHD